MLEPKFTKLKVTENVHVVTIPNKSHFKAVIYEPNELHGWNVEICDTILVSCSNYAECVSVIDDYISDYIKK